jgi:hypothetical protein
MKGTTHMKRNIALLAAAAAVAAFGLSGCGSAVTHHNSAPAKHQACEVQVDNEGRQYCRVVVPPHSHSNDSSDPLIWYYIYMMNQSNQPAIYGSSSINSGGGSWQRSGTIPSSLSSVPNPPVVKIDGDKAEPEEGQEAVETVEEAQANGEEVVNETTDVGEVVDAVDPPAEDAPANDAPANDAPANDAPAGGGESGGGGGESGGGGGEGGGGGGE